MNWQSFIGSKSAQFDALPFPMGKTAKEVSDTFKWLLPGNLRWENWVTTDTGTSGIESWGSWDPWRWRPRYHDDVFARHKAEQRAKKFKTIQNVLFCFYFDFWRNDLTSFFEFSKTIFKNVYSTQFRFRWVNIIYLSIPAETDATIDKFLWTLKNAQFNALPFPMSKTYCGNIISICT